MEDKLDRMTPQLFKDGPGEHLAMQVALAIKNERHFRMVFGEAVDDYDREDYSMRDLPALRVYNPGYRKEHESHYINGNLNMDVILPASIRRVETEDIPSRIATALLQQFRRPGFFERMVQAVPGLNELGKVFEVDKNLTFQNTQMNDECPVVKIVLNFRIDLKAWDAYLEEQGRTKGEPFDVVLEDLKLIATTIQGIDDDASVKITLPGQPVKVGGQ
jgi:hypothetical protein